MPSSTLSKGFKNGWSSGEVGWGPEMNENLARVNALIVDHWGTERATTLGLTYGYVGGPAISGGVLALIAAGTVALTALSVNYVERTPAGAVSKNTTGFSPGAIPMARVTTSGSAITAIEDWRSLSLATMAQDWNGRDGNFSGAVTVTGLSLGTGFRLSTGASAASATAAGVGNGGVANDLALYGQSNVGLWVAGTQLWRVNSSGHFVAAIDNTVDLGSSGANRPRNIYASGQLNATSEVIAQSSNSALTLKATSNTSLGASAAAYEIVVADTIQLELGASKTLGGTIVGSRSSHPLLLVISATPIWQLTASGHLLATVDNSFDIGANGATRPRHVYVAQNITLGGALTATGNISTGGTLTAGSAVVSSLATSGPITMTGGVARAYRTSGSNWSGAVVEDLAASGNTVDRTLVGNVTSLAFSNMSVGAWYTFFLRQDATGGRTIAWPVNVRWPYGAAPALSAANKVDVISMLFDGTSIFAFPSGASL